MIEKFNKAHNNKYDYSKSEYVNARTKIIIICPIHGEFQQIPRKHAAGQGCPKCSAKHTNDYRVLSTEEFINRARAKHGPIYDYNKSRYINSTTKIEIVCPTHGTFWQNPHSHTKGRGCPKCKIVKNIVDYNDVIKQAKSIHNNLYEYGSIIDNKIEIICREHGRFLSSIRQHLLGSGCKKCNYKNNKHKLSMEEYLKRIDYKCINFGNEYITFNCTKHGDFNININNIRNGAACKKCAYEKLSDDNRLDIGEFLSRSSKIHNNKYSYDKVKYINQNTKIIISCPQHGDFEQTPKKHMDGQGCKKCNISKCQLDLYNALADSRIILNDRIALCPYEIDIYWPEEMVGVEVDGLYYHSYQHIESKYERLKHRNKQILASEKSIFLMRFREDEILHKLPIVVSIIKHRLKLSQKIAARKCKIVNIDIKQYREFIEANHLAGYKYARWLYGLEYDGKLMQVISFDNHHKYSYEIVRSATLLGHCVVGGLSKLMKRFIDDINPQTILTYCDARYNSAQGYVNSGFILIDITKPNYGYVKNGTFKSRQNFQKHKLRGILPIFDDELTEPQNMFLNNYRRLWDCGNYKLLWTKI